ncbi:MAG: dihydroneopterin aldolase [Oscillospiraceae bacterium]|nr:dihydroneopterin aldolase [Oscillospiraceae bacterium]
MADKIELVGMEFFGRHGCSEEERLVGQRFLVDAALYLDLASAGRTDDIGETVDYAQVFDDVRHVVEGKSAALLETVAERIAAMLLEKYARLDRVRITVHKPFAPLPGRFADASVTIRRSRTRA